MFMFKEAHVEHIIQHHLQKALNISKNVEYSCFLGNLCQCLATLTVNRYFLILRGNIPHMFQFGPSSSSPVTGCHWKHPSHSLFRHLHILRTSIHNLFLYRQQSLNSLTLLLQEMLQFLCYLKNALSSSPVSPVVQNPELGIVLQLWPYQC